MDAVGGAKCREGGGMGGFVVSRAGFLGRRVRQVKVAGRDSAMSQGAM